MEHSTEILGLIRKASTGQRQAMAKLLRATQTQLFAYLLRLTQNFDLAKDLLKEVQKEMVNSLWRLNKADRFWHWIYDIALQKVREDYQDTRKHETLYQSDAEEAFFVRQFNSEKILQDTFFRETDVEKLFATTYAGMKQAGLLPRCVLIMRCFDAMSFYEISEFLGCSETNARVMFYRAKRRLKKQLRRNGFKSRQIFLPALGLFGSITSQSATAATPAIIEVPPKTIEVGFYPAMIGFLTTKTGMLLSAVFSFFLAWFAIAHLLFMAIGTALLIPVILVMFISFAYQR